MPSNCYSTSAPIRAATRQQGSKAAREQHKAGPGHRPVSDRKSLLAQAPPCFFTLDFFYNSRFAPTVTTAPTDTNSPSDQEGCEDFADKRLTFGRDVGS